MPGNEFGDRVHNFFAPDNLSQGQHQPHVLQGSWPVLNSNIWANGQMQVDVPNASSNNYISQNSDLDRRQTSYPANAANGLSFSRSDLGPDFCKNQSLNEQPYANGFMHGDQIYRTRQHESNFMPVNTNPDQHHLIASRGLPLHGMQQGCGSEQQAKATGRLETPLPSVSFDLFGSQQQINHQQASMMQAIQQQQSGLNDMQNLQQQFFIKKMQDLQRQQQLRQSDLRTQDLMNQSSPLNMNASGHQSTLVAGTPNSDTLQEPGTNWLSGSSSSMQQGSPGGFGFPPNVVQTQRLMNLVPQEVDQSLYGVPVSNSRGLALNNYSQMELDGSPMSQMPTSSNSQYNFLPDQNGMQDGNYILSKKFHAEDKFGHSSSQLLNSGMRDTRGLQHTDSMQRNAPQHDPRGRQGIDSVSEALQERPPRKVTSSRNEVALDPTEEKILYGSADNIWDVLGNGGETSNLFDNGGVQNGLASMQSGVWSALMQSAVADTSSNDLGPQEWSDVTLHNTDCSPNQAPILHNDNVKRASLPNENSQLSPALSSASFPPSADNVMGLNQIGHEFQSVSIQRGPANTPHLFGQSLDEANKQLNPILLQKSVAKGSQIRGTGSQSSPNAEGNSQTISPSWAPRHGGSREQNGMKALAGVPLGRDRVSNIHENEKLQNYQDHQSRVIQGEAAHGNSLWKSDSVLNSNDFGRVNSTVDNYQMDKGFFSLNHAAASVENSGNVGVDHETGRFAQNNLFLNQWQSAHPSAKFQGGQHLGRMLDEVNGQNQGSVSLSSSEKDGVTRQDLENRPKRENSTDSHHSNLSQRASGGRRENRLSEAIDSRPTVLGKQKLTNNQHFVKDSIHRKFQYHPMGNLDEDEERTFGLKQPTQDVRQKDAKPFGTSNKPSQGQNMLDLFQKLDQSGDHVASPHQSSECNLQTQLPRTDKFDGSAVLLQRAQSSVSQGFGLELGPPSLRLQSSEVSSSSSPNGQGMVDSTRACHSGAEMEGKGLPRIPSSSIQSVPLPVVESQVEFKDGMSAGAGHHGSENYLYKVRRSYHPAFTSDIPSARNQLDNQQTKSEKSAQNHYLDSSFGRNTPHFIQKGLADTVQSDSSHQIQKDDLYSSGMNDVRGGTQFSDQMRNSRHLGNSGISQLGVSSQALHSTLTKVQVPEQNLVSQNPKSPLHFSELSQSNIVESSSQGDLNFGKAANLPSKLSAIHTSFRGVDMDQHRMNIDLGPKIEEPVGKMSSIKNHLDELPGNSASTQDIQAFGRSLKPNSFSNEQHALLNQMKHLRDAESDPSIRLSKRIKGSDNNLHGQVNLMSRQQNEGSAGNSSGFNSGVPSDGFGTPSVATPWNNLERSSSLQGNVASRDTVMPGLDASQSHPSANCPNSVRPEHQVSPQMAPSWFNQYGNFKNGQMLPEYNAHNMQEVVSSKPPGSTFILGKPSNILSAINSQEKIVSAPTPVDSCQVGDTLLNSVSTPVVNEHLPSPLPLQLNVTPEHQVILRPQKPQTATSELQPWHKEISNCSKALSTLSVAEAGWSKAMNRLTEKIEGDTELIEDGHPVFRLRRRLILTTQLTQQLFYPPPRNILAGNASSKYESMAYAVSRLALGDACSSVSFSRNSVLPADGVNLQSVKGKLSGNPQFAKAIEDLSEKTNKLENDFVRLDKRVSILDVRVELQDLEKYSIINRFAKFHGRTQNDNAETASINATERPYVQRYVTALPMPKNIPDGVQCLSL